MKEMGLPRHTETVRYVQWKRVYYEKHKMTASWYPRTASVDRTVEDQVVRATGVSRSLAIWALDLNINDVNMAIWDVRVYKKQV